VTQLHFFHAIADAIRHSDAHADMLELHRKAAELRQALASYLDRYGDRDLSAESLDMVAARLSPEDREDYLEQIQSEIGDWDRNAFADVGGFHWTLSNFTSLIESQLYEPIKRNTSETDTDLEDSDDGATAIIAEATA
jgi:hypothetical protein